MAIDKDRITQELYISFRTNPENDMFEDAIFCSEYSVPMDKLQELKTLSVLGRIEFGRPHLPSRCPYCRKEIVILMFTKK